MRLVSWNCAGGYGKKAERILALEPDLLVIQEITENDADVVEARSAHWVGLPRHKGMAVFGFDDVPCELVPWPSNDLRWYLPVRWNGLGILAIWAHIITSPRRYVRVMHEALDVYGSFLTAGPGIIIGDLNSNTVLVHKPWGRSHTDLVTRLNDLGFASVYHVRHNEAPGSELTPTFFLYRHLDTPYHFDFVFAANALSERAHLSIGAVED